MRIRGLGLVILVLFSGGCDHATTEPTPEGQIRASLNGTPWAANGIVANQTGLPGYYEIFASDAGSAVRRPVNLYLYNIAGPGVYPLGVWGQLTGGAAFVSETFSTPFNGAAGEVRITSLTATHIAGTFKFRAEQRSILKLPAPLVPNSVVTVTDSILATQGSFNLPITSKYSGSFPDSAGGTATGVIGVNNTPFTAASGIAYVRPRSLASTFFVVVENEEYTVSVALNDYKEPGTYTFNSSSTERGASLSKRLSFLDRDGTYAPFIDGWSTQNPGGTGTITITSVSASRIRGHYSATIAAPAQPNSMASIRVSMSFDLKRVNY